jgi:hypothetical protein
MAMAAMLVSAVVGLAGSFMQASAMNAQAKAQEQIAEFNAKQKEVEASRRQAEGQLRGQLEEKEAQSLSARARAGFAQIGVDTTQGSPLLLEQELAAEGQFRKNLEIASAQNEQRSLQEGAKADRFEGKIRAMASRAQAKASLLGGIGSAFGSLAKINFG